MARTPEGAALTEQHYRAQAQLRAQTLRDYLTLWPIWQGDDDSFNTLVAATIPLVRAYHRLSVSVAGAYFDSFRRAERAGGTSPPRLAAPLEPDRLVASLHITGRVQTVKALRSGQRPEVAMRTALVRTSGAVTRHVMSGGRDTIDTSTREDREAIGWARVTAASPCAFCAMVASRGPVYGKETVGFEAHDHCACTGEPAYADSEWPGRAREFAALYKRAQREARANGTHAEGTVNPALTNFRRLLEGR